MLPDWLNHFLIFFVSILVPTVCSLYSLGHSDRDAIRKWLSYFTFYAGLTLVLSMLEPLVLAVLGLLPVSFYLELKLAGFFLLVCPRFGLMDKIEQHLEHFIDTKGKAWYVALRDQCHHFRAKAAEILLSKAGHGGGQAKKLHQQQQQAEKQM